MHDDEYRAQKRFLFRNLGQCRGFPLSVASVISVWRAYFPSASNQVECYGDMPYQYAMELIRTRHRDSVIASN